MNKSKRATNRGDVDVCPWYEIRSQLDDDESSAELRIFGPIGGGFFFDEDAVTGKGVAEELSALPDSVKTINVLVNSPGGSVFDGVHIANELRRQREEHGRTVNVEIEALAASAATLITSAGENIRMPRNALMMVHNPSAVGIGDSRLLRELAGVLDKVRKTIVSTYQWVSSLSADRLTALMDDTTWMEADEALANGFITEIVAPVEVAASLDEEGFEFLATLEIPAALQERVTSMIGNEPGLSKAKSRSKKTMTKQATPAPDNGTQGDANALAKAARAAERQRTKEIRSAAGVAVAAGLDPERVAEMTEAAVENETAPDAFRVQIFEALTELSEQTGPDPNSRCVEAGDDERDKRVRAMTAALLNRAGVAPIVQEAKTKQPEHKAFRDVEFDAGPFRGMTLAEFARNSVETAKPGSTVGKTRMEVARLFLNQVGQGTNDFAVAFEEALHKTLVAAYSITPDTWRRFCATRSVSDFRAHNFYKRSFLSRLDKVLEDGGFRNKNVGDAEKETLQASTFGNIVVLSRQAIVNDDLGMFNDMAAALGRAAALSVELEVYDTLALNANLGPTMNDGVSLFHANHNNVGTGAAISIASLEADMILMASQTDPSGNEVLDLMPFVLVVPIGLKGQALQINEAQFEDFNRGKPNRVLGLFADIVGTARLSGTRRYMFANPATDPTLAVAFLEGEQEPVMEMEDGFRVDGVSWKVRHDYGVGAIDYRTAVTNAGV